MKQFGYCSFEVYKEMGTILGPCKKCGKIVLSPHPSGLCIECRIKSKSQFQPNIPDLPDPLKYERK